MALEKNSGGVFAGTRWPCAEKDATGSLCLGRLGAEALSSGGEDGGFFFLGSDSSGVDADLDDDMDAVVLLVETGPLAFELSHCLSAEDGDA